VASESQEVALPGAVAFTGKAHQLNMYLRQYVRDRTVSINTCHGTTALSYVKAPRAYTGITPVTNAPRFVLYAPLTLLDDLKAADRPQSRTHVLCHHTQSPRHLTVPSPADPVNLVYLNKAIFVLSIVNEHAAHLTRHTDMLVVLHVKVKVSLAINLNVRRLTQAFVDVTELFLRTVAEMHVTDRQGGPRRTVFPDESCKVVHVHDARVKTELPQSRDGRSFSKNAQAETPFVSWKLIARFRSAGTCRSPSEICLPRRRPLPKC